jgi:hypothetical protein
MGTGALGFGTGSTCVLVDPRFDPARGFSRAVNTVIAHLDGRACLSRPSVIFQ